VWSLEPPARLRLRAPGHFQPVALPLPERVLDTFLATRPVLLRRLEALDGLPLDALKVPSPADPRFRYSVWSLVNVIAAHERRHLWQAERLARAVDA
jgi:hypothetical protein